MKKLILSFSIIALAVVTANAQVTFGVKTGLNLSTLGGSDANSTNFPGKKIKIGMNVGGVVSIHVAKIFSIQSEALFSMEGTNFSGGSDRLNYINIPVLTHFASSRGFFIEMGPQIGFLVSAKEKTTGQPDVNIKEFLQSTDFSLVYGLGYLTHSGFGFNVRSSLGINSIDKGSGGTKAKINNFVTQVGVFYMFGGKGR